MQLLEKMRSRPKLEYMDYFRGFAIVYIVAGHTIRFGPAGSEVFNTTTYIFAGGSYLFLFISGYLFQYLSYKFDYVSYLKKKFVNVILPYLIAILPGAIALAVTCNDKANYLYDKAIWVRFLEPFLWGDLIMVPLWYIPVIVIIFALSPILIKLFKNKVIWYSLLISGLIYIFIGNRFISEFNCRLTANIDTSIIQWNLKYLYTVIGRVLVFIPAYMLGMTACELIEHYYEIINKNAKKISQIFLLSWVISYVPIIHILHFSEGKMTVARFVLLIAIVSYFIFAENLIKKTQWLDKTLKFLAEYSFGIFFIHYYICNLLFFHSLYRRWDAVWYAYTYKGTLTCLLHAVGNFFIVLFTSILILVVIKKILIKCGIKNTRMFIGVGNTKK